MADGWRYQPVWTEDAGGPTFSVCEIWLDEQDRLTRWDEEPFTWPGGDDMGQLTRDLVRMLVDAYRWKAVAFSSLKVGMIFERAIDGRKAEALARMVETMNFNLRTASGMSG